MLDNTYGDDNPLVFNTTLHARENDNQFELMPADEPVQAKEVIEIQYSNKKV